MGKRLQRFEEQNLFAFVNAVSIFVSNADIINGYKDRLFDVYLELIIFLININDLSLRMRYLEHVVDYFNNIFAKTGEGESELMSSLKKKIKKKMMIVHNKEYYDYFCKSLLGLRLDRKSFGDATSEGLQKFKSWLNDLDMED